MHTKATTCFIELFLGKLSDNVPQCTSFESIALFQKPQVLAKKGMATFMSNSA